MSSRDEVLSYSPITRAAERFFRGLQYLPPQVFVRSRSELTPQEVASKESAQARARRIDCLVMVCVGVELIAAGTLILAHPEAIWIRIVLGMLVALRIVDIVQVTVNISIFDALRGRSDHLIASVPRVVVLAFVNFLELLLCFGVLYALDIARLAKAHGVLSAWYFSVITQLTIGYGDIAPTGWLRLIAATQGLVSLVFVVLVFARILASLPQFGQVEAPPPSTAPGSETQPNKGLNPTAAGR